MKKSLSALFFTLIMFQAPLVAAPLAFTEIWAYVMRGEEASIKPGLPISDLGCFGAGISSTGKLVDVPDIGKYSAYSGRKHLVIAEIGNRAITHFVINPDYPIREAFILQVIEASQDWDGLQIDFEAVLAQDKENLYSFFTELRSRLPGKVFSIAVPARIDDRQGIWEYARLGTCADRIIIMAYDEHWSGSSPGSIASLDWCKKVAAYAQTRISPSRLVMGLPFYGRAWVDKSLAKSYKHPTVQRIIAEEKIGTIKRDREIPYFTYSKTVKVTLYYEDLRSLKARLSLYAGMGVPQIAFWSLGQEDTRIWAEMSIKDAPQPEASPQPSIDASHSPSTGASALPSPTLHPGSGR